MELAKKLILEAKKAGADCVKFQSWSKDTIFSKIQYKENYFLADDYRNRTDTNLEKIVEEYSISEEELLELLGIVLDQIEFISLKEIDKRILKQGYELTIIDPLDAPFVALSLFLDAKLWTGDKKLCRYLASKGFDICISTQELLEFL